MKNQTGTPSVSLLINITDWRFIGLQPKLLVLLLFAMASVTCSAQGQEDSLNNVRIKLLNGSSIRATIEAIDDTGNIRGSEMLSGIPLDKILSVDTGREQQKVSNKSPLVFLARGGTVYFKNVQLDGEQLLLTDSKTERSIALEITEGIVWKFSETVSRAFAERSSEQDIVIVRTNNGESQVPGLLEGIDNQYVSLNYKGKTRKISRSKVMAIAMAQIETQIPTGLLATVDMTDSSRIIGNLQRIQDGKLALLIAEKQPFEISVSDLSKLTLQSDRLIYVSDLQPVSEEQQTQFSAPRPWQRDRSLLGNPLKLRYSSGSKIHEFEKGIGTRSYTSIAFANDGFDQFSATVGIDSETNGQGDCEMVVSGDGIRLWQERVRADEDPKQVKVDISGIKQVTLTVMPGEQFDLADHANWADAKFTRN